MCRRHLLWSCLLSSMTQRLSKFIRFCGSLSVEKIFVCGWLVSPNLNSQGIPIPAGASIPRIIMVLRLFLGSLKYFVSPTADDRHFQPQNLAERFVQKKITPKNYFVVRPDDRTTYLSCCDIAGHHFGFSSGPHSDPSVLVWWDFYLQHQFKKRKEDFSFNHVTPRAMIHFVAHCLSVLRIFLPFFHGQNENVIALSKSCSLSYNLLHLHMYGRPSKKVPDWTGAIKCY